MGLGAAYLGEVELQAVMDTFVALANVDDAEESVYLGILSCLIEATCQAQDSGVARNRLAESLVAATGPGGADIPIAPTVSRLLVELGSACHIMRQELRAYTAAASDAQRLATDGDNHNWALLGEIH